MIKYCEIRVKKLVALVLTIRVILCIVIFIFTFLFKTDIMGFVYVCMILLVNNVSYMTRAGKLERRR